ncbi:hypothetical protein FS842_007978 [Serendipita sp. 407]|nr:hypothetical protein FS842_007978 [Serendipita sp. 407]
MAPWRGPNGQASDSGRGGRARRAKRKEERRKGAKSKETRDKRARRAEGTPSQKRLPLVLYIYTNPHILTDVSDASITVLHNFILLSLSSLPHSPTTQLICCRTASTRFPVLGQASQMPSALIGDSSGLLHMLPSIHSFSLVFRFSLFRRFTASQVPQVLCSP